MAHDGVFSPIYKLFCWNQRLKSCISVHIMIPRTKRSWSWMTCKTRKILKKRKRVEPKAKTGMR